MEIKEHYRSAYPLPPPSQKQAHGHPCSRRHIYARVQRFEYVMMYKEKDLPCQDNKENRKEKGHFVPQIKKRNISFQKSTGH